MGFLSHRDFQYFTFYVFPGNQNCTGNAKVRSLSVFWEKQQSKHLGGRDWDTGWSGPNKELCWSSQVLKFVPNQSEIEGFLLLFPTETLFRKLILTILWIGLVFGLFFFFLWWWDCISATTIFSVALLC